jgi:hypothetical protein
MELSARRRRAKELLYADELARETPRSLFFSRESGLAAAPRSLMTAQKFRQ